MSEQIEGTIAAAIKLLNSNVEEPKDWRFIVLAIPKDPELGIFGGSTIGTAEGLTSVFKHLAEDSPVDLEPFTVGNA